jgi:beta-aspartyl-dipeptidase (metallo-type)
MFTLIENADIYTPEAIGITSILLAYDHIAQIGTIDRKALIALFPDCQVIDAKGCIVIPGFIDPHEHLIGAGGENGFKSRMPEVSFEQIVTSGITTVVGLLGTDTATRRLDCLHAKINQLSDEGITAYMFSGGFELPPTTLTGSLLNDLVMIDKAIGAGEIAISDYRWVDPDFQELARLVTEVMVGGKMGGKAGVTHFHVGDGKKRLSLLKDLLDDYDIPAKCLYATHITRSKQLMKDAIALAECGAFVDMDTVEENIGECLQYYLEHHGPIDQLTMSSDAHTPGGSPEKLYGQFVSCILEHALPLTTVLPCFTRNTADVLALKQKGRLEPNCDADITIMDTTTLEIRHVFARGKHMVSDGSLIHTSEQHHQMQMSRSSPLSYRSESKV